MWPFSGWESTRKGTWPSSYLGNYATTEPARSNVMRTPICLLTLLAVELVCGYSHAEKPPMSSADLLDTSTNVVIGRVLAIYQRTEMERGWKYIKYVAEIRVDHSEKGQGVPSDSLIYVRYWQKEWKGKGSPPPDESGHYPIPDKNNAVRVYLARNSYDGFTFENKDGGFNVIGANGFEKLPSTVGK